MSWLNDLDPAQETANAANALTFTDKPPAPRLFQGGWSALGTGTMAGGAESARALGVIGGMAPPLMFDRAFMGGEQSDAYYRAMEATTQPALDYWKPDPETTGKASEILFGGARFLVPLMLTPGSPAGIVATEQTSRTVELGKQGVDDNTALAGGVLSGVTVGAGGMVPGSGIVKGAAADLLATMGINVALGAGERYGMNQLLEANGYAEQAAQYRVLDEQAMAADLVLGSLFWGVSRLGTPTATPEQVDAALTVEAEVHRKTTAGPGLPVDPASAKASADAIDTAIQSLLRGEKVDVGEAIRNATFLRLPRAEVSPALRAGYEPLSPGFDAAVARVLDDEGGYVNDPADRGGETNFGISSRANPDIDVANLTREQAAGIYRARYWNEIEADELPADLQGVAFDAAVNHGVGWTKKALAESGGDTAAFIRLREAHYRSIVANDPSQAKFLRGWLNRVGRYKETSPAGKALRERLVKNPEQLFEEYATRPDAKGGQVLNTDVARELSPEYLSDRTRSADVHEAASDTIKTLYETRLARPTPEGMDRTVLFTAGGTGAGKTTGIEAMGTALGRPEIIYDTNMNTLSSAVEKVEQALNAGRSVDIAYVYRDPVEALTGGAITRAQRQAKEFGSGRTVPLSEHAKTHAGVRGVIEALADRYKDDPRVNITAIDNSRGKGNETVVELADLPRVEETTLNERLQEALDQAREAGLDEALYRGFAAQGRPGEGLVGNRRPDRGQASARQGLTQPSGLGAAGLETSSPSTTAGVARPTPSVMDPDGPPPKTGASGLPDTPAITAAAEAATLNPSLNIVLDDGTVVSAADALATLAKEQAQVEIDAGGYLAAANCFLRSA